MPNISKYKQKNEELVKSHIRQTLTGRANCSKGNHKWVELKGEGYSVCKFCNEVK